MSSISGFCKTTLQTPHPPITWRAQLVHGRRPEQLRERRGGVRAAIPMQGRQEPRVQRHEEGAADEAVVEVVGRGLVLRRSGGPDAGARSGWALGSHKMAPTWVVNRWDIEESHDRRVMSVLANQSWTESIKLLSKWAGLT